MPDVRFVVPVVVTYTTTGGIATGCCFEPRMRTTLRRHCVAALRTRDCGAGWAGTLVWL